MFVDTSGAVDRPAGREECERQCNAKHGCHYISSLDECHLSDPCVRKAKRGCRSASHCRWDMDMGRCYQLDIVDTSGDKKTAEIYRANGMSDSDCEGKNFNGCINDFYCKWYEETHQSEWWKTQSHDRSTRCYLHPCRQFDKSSCGLVLKDIYNKEDIIRQGHHYKRADGSSQMVETTIGDYSETKERDDTTMVRTDKGYIKKETRWVAKGDEHTTANDLFPSPGTTKLLAATPTNTAGVKIM